VRHSLLVTRLTGTSLWIDPTGDLFVCCSPIARTIPGFVAVYQAERSSWRVADAQLAPWIPWSLIRQIRPDLRWRVRHLSAAVAVVTRLGREHVSALSRFRTRRRGALRIALPALAAACICDAGMAASYPGRMPSPVAAAVSRKRWLRPCSDPRCAAARSPDLRRIAIRRHVLVRGISGSLVRQEEETSVATAVSVRKRSARLYAG